MKLVYPEAATPIDDLSGLKPKWVKTQSALNRAEAENISEALEKFLFRKVAHPEKWFQVGKLKEIHRTMFYRVWEWAGKFRTTQTIPGMKPYQIHEAMEALCQDVSYWCNNSSGLTLTEQAAKIHHRLVLIHPFSNGNGRFSRLVSDRYLKALGSPMIKWPIDIGTEGNSRREYIEALRSADHGDYSPLLLYMMKCRNS